jgi:hypothetical protein
MLGRPCGDANDIVRSHPQFLLIQESGRAWFHHLRTTRDVSAQKLAEVTEDDQSCTLWRVTSVKARPGSQRPAVPPLAVS